MTPRSGSTLLAQQLSARCGLGHAGEFLNEGFIANFEHLFPTPSLADFQRFVLANFTSPDGVFGLKADWFRFERARELEYLPRIYENIDLYVLLRRRDFVAQAVSLAISMQSGIWHENDVWFTRPKDVYAGLAYDEALIAENVLSLMEQEHQWEAYLRTQEAQVIPLFYEDFTQALDPTLSRICAALGCDCVEGEARAFGKPIRPTPSPVNAEWRERFLADRPVFVEHWRERRGAQSIYAPEATPA